MSWVRLRPSGRLIQASEKRQGTARTPRRFASNWVADMSARFWTAAVLCRVHLNDQKRPAILIAPRGPVVSWLVWGANRLLCSLDNL